MRPTASRKVGSKLHFLPQAAHVKKGQIVDDILITRRSPRVSPSILQWRLKSICFASALQSIPAMCPSSEKRQDLTAEIVQTRDRHHLKHVTMFYCWQLFTKYTCMTVSVTKSEDSSIPADAAVTPPSPEWSKIRVRPIPRRRLIPDTRYYRPHLYRYRYRAVQIFCIENAILCRV